MLTFSGLLREEDGMLTYMEKPPEHVPEAAPLIPSPGRKVEITPKPLAFPVTIMISVTESTDIEKLKALIKAVKEALE